MNLRRLQEWCNNLGGFIFTCVTCMVGIPADQNSPKWRSTGNIWNIAYWISDSLWIETYLIHIYHMNKCSKCNWNMYFEGFCMWNVHFHINGLSPNITYVILMTWMSTAGSTHRVDPPCDDQPPPTNVPHSCTPSTHSYCYLSLLSCMWCHNTL